MLWNAGVPGVGSDLQSILNPFSRAMSIDR